MAVPSRESGAADRWLHGATGRGDACLRVRSGLRRRLPPEKLSVFSYTEMRGKLLLDDRYVLELRLNDAAFKDKLRRFVRASMTGGPMPRTIPKKPPTSS